MSSLLAVYERDLVLVKGKGALLFDKDGRSYVDFAGGIAVNSFGHADTKIVNAIKKQAASLIHCSNLYLSEPVMELADRLVAAAFPSKVFFSNSGTEAVEAALKFARRIGRPSSRSEIVAFEGSFHGRTLGALSVTWTAKYREPFEPLLPGVRFCPWGDLDALRALVGPETAAVIVEPVQGESGVRPAHPDFLRGIVDICRERGALLIADEIQTGLGRTGKMFAYEHAGITPDILTLAKPLGGGLPLGAVLLRDGLADAIVAGDHGSTFGGNPVAAAASLTILDRLTTPGFLEEIQAKGRKLRTRLDKLARRFNQVLEVRGQGLMLGMEFKGSATSVVAGLRERGFLAVKAGDRVLRLLPPFIIPQGEIKRFAEALEEILVGGAGCAS